MSLFIPHDKVGGGGLFIRVQAGEAVGGRKVVYIDTDGTWKLANAAAVATMPSVGLTMHAIESGKYGWVLIKGFIGLASWSWTRGGVLYVSETTAGELTHTQPSGTTDSVQSVGYASEVTQIFFSPRQIQGKSSATYTKQVHIGVGTFKIPAAGAPNVQVQDNTVMFSFNQNDTEDAYLSWRVASDYAGGDLTISIHWTNDGGTDDNGKNVLWEVNYQSMTDGDAVSGSHANSPKTAADTYTSASGRIFHTTPDMVIAAADFASKMQINFQLTALAAAPTQLTGESQFVSMMLSYKAYIDLG